jgi:two-component system sensor histidine kinase and response regulator WspE
MSDFAMIELFRSEVEEQTRVFTEGLLALERPDDGARAGVLESLMRAAHSLKGAARLVRLEPAEKMAHAMEGCFVAAQKGELQVGGAQTDLFLEGVDLIGEVSRQNECSLPEWSAANNGRIEALCGSLAGMLKGEKPPAAPVIRPAVAAPVMGERSLKLSTDRLDALVGLAGEVQVATGRLRTMSSSVRGLKRQTVELMARLGRLEQEVPIDGLAAHLLAEVRQLAVRFGDSVNTHYADLDNYERRMFALSARLHQEVVASRMTSFGEGVEGFPRLVRDLARDLDKAAELNIEGRQTPVDRDVLQRIESPLTHLLRNALDHGLESPEDRMNVGKPPQGSIRLRAAHRGGRLEVELSDDGRGIDLEQLRRAVVAKGLTSVGTAEQLSGDELLEFLFLPAFTTKHEVSEISGRGVGLDVVRSVIMELGGKVKLNSTLGQGTRFCLQLPLTLSVVRNLLVEIAGEPYALPLNRIDSVMRIGQEQLVELEGISLFPFREAHLALITARRVLDLPPVEQVELSVVVLGGRYGLVVDRFIGEQDLVVQPLDIRFGKQRNVAAGAILEDGSPVLILDVEDLLQSIERIRSSGRLDNLRAGEVLLCRTRRILVVDDSITVREVERKILEVRGYEVDVAVDGMDGWNALRANRYDLLVSDIDMPRLDGLKLTIQVRSDASLSALPIILVSYKDRSTDRLAGLEAGADAYLTKSSFDDDSFLRAVVDLIGEP